MSTRVTRSSSIRSLVHAIVPFAIGPVWLLVSLKHQIRRILRRSSETRAVLLVCHNPVAAAHLVPLAALLHAHTDCALRVSRELLPSQENDAATIREITCVPYVPVLLALLRDWDLIVYVNHPWGFGAWFWPGIPKLYINHGLHAGKINNELGEDGVYGPHRTTRR